VSRHAHARGCRVVLRTDRDEVLLRIDDDGDGLAADAAPGVGLRSMRERAAELGGRVELASSPDGGLVVEVRFARVTADTT
jgi:signal transduction histidine kinase